MELVEQCFLPGFGEPGLGIRSPRKPGQRRVFLGIEQLFFTGSHVSFVVGLRRHHAAMVFKVQLVVPHGQAEFAGRRHGQAAAAAGQHFVVPDGSVFGIELGFDTGKKILCRTEFHLRNPPPRVGPMNAAVEHGARGAAAVVADAVQVHHERCARVAFPRGVDIGGDSHRINLVHVIVGEVGQHAAAVGGLPPEQLEGERIGVVPRHLLRNEIVDPRLLVDLRQLPVIAKRIRVPSDAHVRPKFLLEVALADQQLAHERLAVRHVQIGLHPHAPHHFPAPFFDTIDDLLVQRRIFLQHPLVVGGGRLRVGVLRVFVHELQGRAERAADDIHGFGPRPQPSGVDVGVSRQTHRGSFEVRFQFQQRRMGRVERSVEGLLLGLAQPCKIHGLRGPRQALLDRPRFVAEGGKQG